MNAPMLDREAARPPRLTTALRISYLAVGLAILAAPALDMIVPFFEQAPLTGVVAAVPRPELTVQAVASEAFQTGFTKYFEQHYGVRPLATRLDNSLAYWIFNEQPPDKSVRVGTNGVLYLQDQINYYNVRAELDPAPVAANFRRAQDLLLARGKVLVVMLLPTKTNVWPDDVPRAWRRDGASPEKLERELSTPYADAMRKAGVFFVDGRKASATLPREAIYAKTGRHLTAPATCRILAEAFDVARPLLHEATIPPIDCSYRMDPNVPLDTEDRDLFKLLNVWAPNPTDGVPVTGPTPELVARDQRPSMMVLGSSFGWKVAREAERTHSVGHVLFHYYLTTLVDFDGGPHRPVALRSKEWQDLVASTTLFLAAVPEEYLIHDNEPFAEAIIATYGGTDASAEPVKN